MELIAGTAAIIGFGLLIWFVSTMNSINNVIINSANKLHSIEGKLLDMEKRINATNKILSDINRHICDGFNGIAEYLSNK